jgi:hypothetical protein
MEDYRDIPTGIAFHDENVTALIFLGTGHLA